VLNKLLFKTLIILTFIIIIEIFFYLILSFKKNSAPQVTQLSKLLEQLQIKESNENNALDPNLLYNLLTSSQNIKKDLLKSYIVEVVLFGKIKELSSGKKNQSEYIMKLVIESDKGQTHELILPRDNQQQTSTLKLFDENKKAININDLTVGNKINIKIKMDITDSKGGQSKYDWEIIKL